MKTTLYYGRTDRPTFCDVWDEAEKFITDFKESKLYRVDNTESGEVPIVKDENLEMLYFLLYGRYGNSRLASRDTNQFKYTVFSIIRMYGPTWERRLEAQRDIRNLKISELQSGAISTFDVSLNPETITPEEAEMEFINQRNKTKNEKSLMDAYIGLDAILKTDVSAYFLDRFSVCFTPFPNTACPLLYEQITTIEEVEE